jgi:ribosomal protein S18 acetylase RimI-like enzyme
MTRILEIVKAVPSDADAIAELVNSAYRGERSKKGWTTEADLLDGTRTDATILREIIETDGHTVLKCMWENSLVGCVELVINGAEMYVGMLTAKPDLQGSGIGKTLLHAAEDEARAKKCEKITMTVISVRTELIAWYERHGYVNTHERKPFPKNDPRFGVPKQLLEFTVLEKKIQ